MTSERVRDSAAGSLLGMKVTDFLLILSMLKESCSPGGGGGGGGRDRGQGSTRKQQQQQQQDQQQQQEQARSTAAAAAEAAEGGKGIVYPANIESRLKLFLLGWINSAMKTI